MLLLITAGFEGFVSQHVIVDDRGTFVARVDFGYPDQRIVVEYDGALHWEQRREDDRRRDKLRALGWRVFVMSAADYYKQPQVFLDQLRRAFAVGLALPEYRFRTRCWGPSA
jgi:very-short-patch-repair endonuclease